LLAFDLQSSDLAAKSFKLFRAAADGAVRIIFVLIANHEPSWRTSPSSLLSSYEYIRRKVVRLRESELAFPLRGNSSFFARHRRDEPRGVQQNRLFARLGRA
jgi:hypothetical protein